MTLNEFLESIKQACSFLEQEGYALRKVDTSVNRNFWYEKHSETEGYRISFGWTQYGEEFHVKGLSALKRFNSIEQEIQKVIGGNLIDYYTIHKSPSIEYVPEGLFFDRTEKNIHFVLKNQNDIELFADFIKEFYTKTVFMFYNQFINLSEVFKAYCLLEREMISSLILNTGTDIFYRELIIKHKFKSSDKNDFVAMVLNELESIKNNATFSKMLENFNLIQLNLNQGC